eukprot:TRINITY_DN3044_c0_g1_i1.p1 TRINITY_DN3044_c0_g1~~TRINITY_DN3044_c0_g1_i1.p1  ORF type:complete len:121 (+),score=8.03 TRINITY_DN3044_c0_g1_i1:282-644(+)
MVAYILIDINAISPKVIWIRDKHNIVVDCLFQLVDPDTQEVNIIYNVSSSLRQKIMKTYHGRAMGIHLSAEYMLRNIKQKYYWKGMCKGVKTRSVRAKIDQAVQYNKGKKECRFKVGDNT